VAEIRITPEDLEKALSLTESDAQKTALAGLLEYYSNRATAHASFSIAVVFGIFTLLTLPKPRAQWYPVYSILFDLVYSALWLASIYLFLNFGWYTQIADKTKYLLLGTSGTLVVFAAYKKLYRDSSFDDFLYDWMKADWMYETAKDFYSEKELDEEKQRAIVSEERYKWFKWFHRRYAEFKYGATKTGVFRKFFGCVSTSGDDKTWDRELWKGTLHGRIVPDHGKYHRACLLCFVLLLIGGAIWFLRFVGDLQSLSNVKWFDMLWAHIVSAAIVIVLSSTVLRYSSIKRKIDQLHKWLKRYHHSTLLQTAPLA